MTRCRTCELEHGDGECQDCITQAIRDRDAKRNRPGRTPKTTTNLVCPNFLSNLPGSIQKDTPSERFTDQLSDLLTPLPNGRGQKQKVRTG